MSMPELYHDALEIVGALLFYGKGHGEYLITMQWCSKVLGAATHPPSVALARALLTYGATEMHVLGSRASMQTPTLPRAIAMAAEAGDRWVEAYACCYRAMSCIDSGRTDEAMPLLARAESLIAASGDAVLQGLLALVRGWVQLAAGRPAQAIAALEQADAGCADIHQDHFIAVYVGLSYFMLGDLAAAARAWLRSLALVPLIRNRRGLAGIVEGCAYLCARLGIAEPATRFLAVAATVRMHTGIPLFTFWLSLNQQAQQQARAMLGGEAYQAADQAGRGQRLELVAEEARAILLQVAVGTAIEKRPPGS